MDILNFAFLHHCQLSSRASRDIQQLAKENQKLQNKQRKLIWELVSGHGIAKATVEAARKRAEEEERAKKEGEKKEKEVVVEEAKKGVAEEAKEVVEGEKKQDEPGEGDKDKDGSGSGEENKDVPESGDKTKDESNQNMSSSMSSLVETSSESAEGSAASKLDELDQLYQKNQLAIIEARNAVTDQYRIVRKLEEAVKRAESELSSNKDSDSSPDSHLLQDLDAEEESEHPTAMLETASNTLNSNTRAKKRLLRRATESAKPSEIEAALKRHIPPGEKEEEARQKEKQSEKQATETDGVLASLHQQEKTYKPSIHNTNSIHDEHVRFDNIKSEGKVGANVDLI